MAALLAGMLIGFSLGLTGGGGAILAVPILVYGLGVSPHEAVVISLAAVGSTALIGAVRRWRVGMLDMRAGLIFGAGGIGGAPIGTWLHGQLPEVLLLILFASLMLVVAARMLYTARRQARSGATDSQDDAARHRSALRIIALMIAGLLTGVLAGTFGVGGGFLIVPALLLVDRMPIRLAIGTSLLAIGIIGAGGLVSHLMASNVPSLSLTSLFVIGGIIGLIPAGRLVRRLPPATLQVIFAAVIIVVALLVLAANFSA